MRSLPDLNPFPTPVKLVRLERADSYLRRLYEKNDFTGAEMHADVRTHINRTKLPRGEAIRHLAASRGGIHEAPLLASAGPAHIDGTVCDGCTAGLTERVACRHCSDWMVAIEQPHMRFNICLRHKMYVAPGTDHTTQRRASPDMLRAERKYRRLVRRGLLDAPRFVELLAAFRRWGQLTGRREGEWYPALVDVAATVFQQVTLEQLHDHRLTYAERYETIHELVSAFVPANAAIIVDAIWLILRPSQLAVWEQLTFGAPQMPADPHTQRLTPTGVIRPVEPFSRYVELLMTCHPDRWTDLNLRQLHGGLTPFTKNNVSCSGTLARYICDQGHRLSKAPAAMMSAMQRSLGLCRTCTGSAAQPGWNSAAETHPSIEWMWAADLNDDKFSEVRATSTRKKYTFRCAEQHTWQAYINDIARGRRCGRCSGRHAIPGKTSFAALHPELLRSWDRDRNIVDPDRIRPNYAKPVWWTCDKPGHPSWKTTTYSRILGTGCPTCVNLNIVPYINDFLTSYPHLEAEWAYDLNTVDPRTLAPRNKKEPYWWRCEHGHPYQTTVLRRTTGHGCQYCGFRKLWPGFNDIAARYPVIVEEFDPRNGVDPTQTMPRGKKWLWTCAYGHEKHDRVPHRQLAGGCSVCPKSDRIINRRSGGDE
jgi:hypothetical protein